MSNKQVIAIFIIGLALLLVAFWAGLNVTKRSAVTAGNQAETSVRNPQSDGPQKQTSNDAQVRDQSADEARYIVRVQAFGTLQKAKELETELRRKYISAHTQLPTADDTLYRVNVGPYNRREDAQQVVSELTTDGYKGVMIIPGARN